MEPPNKREPIGSHTQWIELQEEMEMQSIVAQHKWKEQQRLINNTRKRRSENDLDRAYAQVEQLQNALRHAGTDQENRLRIRKRLEDAIQVFQFYKQRHATLIREHGRKAARLSHTSKDEDDINKAQPMVFGGNRWFN